MKIATPQFPFWVENAPILSVAISMLACFSLVFLLAWVFRFLYGLRHGNRPSVEFFPFALLLASTLWAHVFWVGAGAGKRLLDLFRFIVAHSDNAVSGIASCLYEIFFSLIILPGAISPLSILIGLPMCLIHLLKKRLAPTVVYPTAGLIMLTSYVFWTAMERGMQAYNS